MIKSEGFFRVHNSLSFNQVDQLLRQSGAAQVAKSERVMDSNDLEKERGITILSKSTSIEYKGYRINIVDTPGKFDHQKAMSCLFSLWILIKSLQGMRTLAEKLNESYLWSMAFA